MHAYNMQLKCRDFSASGSVQEKLLAQPRRTTITRDQAHGNRAIMRVSFYTPRSTGFLHETLHWPTLYSDLLFFFSMN